MMTTPAFAVADLGQDCFAINDRGRTVAYVTSQGYVDWLLQHVDEDGPQLTSLRKETHLCYTLGLKLLLHMPHFCETMEEIGYEREQDGAAIVLRGRASSEDREFSSETLARLSADPETGAYCWALETCCTSHANEPRSFDTIEYNNIYPGEAGKCMFFRDTKEYQATLMTDRDGAVWRFPHQHRLHYGHLIQTLAFAEGSMAGFFHEAKGDPVVMVDASPLEPFWAICDMYYDLHCMVRPGRPIAPGESFTIRYRVEYLDAADAEALLAKARPIPVPDEDRAQQEHPRVDPGRNTFSTPIAIDRPEEGSAFVTNPPKKVWEKPAEPNASGALRITHGRDEETVWGYLPPTQLPADSVLRISARLRTESATGRGAVLRVRHYTFCWRPEPHLEPFAELACDPVNGTTDDWVEVRLPDLTVTAEQFDSLIDCEFVLSGRGRAWLTDLTLDLERKA